MKERDSSVTSNEEKTQNQIDPAKGEELSGLMIQIFFYCSSACILFMKKSVE